MTRQEKRFYMVREDALPEAILKTIKVKEMLARGEAKNVMEAVEKVDLARSTFYKYRDGIYSFLDAENMNILTISLTLKHLSGILSRVLNCIAEKKGTVLTINQNIPLNGVALVTISIGAEEVTVSCDELISCIRDLPGVVNIELTGRS